jgi:hypothetical protein
VQDFLAFDNKILHTINKLYERCLSVSRKGVIGGHWMVGDPGQGYRRESIPAEEARLPFRGCAIGLIVLSAAIVLIWVLLVGFVGQMAQPKGHSNLDLSVLPG